MAKIVLENVYIDDMLLSVADRETVILMVRDTIDLLKEVASIKQSRFQRT